MSPKNSAAVELGRKGGKARARNLTPEQRKESARKAVEARWQKQKQAIEDSLSKMRQAGSNTQESLKKLSSKTKTLSQSITALERRGEAYERRSAVRSKKIDKLLKIAKGEQ